MRLRGWTTRTAFLAAVVLALGACECPARKPSGPTQDPGNRCQACMQSCENQGRSDCATVCARDCGQ
ncbi:MAG TPA: hypothetical protein VEB43_18840 [Anaeromyxobacter sp.]|nr:hypothetical protein [Anaeromyxobacter sp.]